MVTEFQMILKIDCFDDFYLLLLLLEFELYLIWKYECKDEYIPVYILMFIYLLGRIKYFQ